MQMLENTNGNLIERHACERQIEPGEEGHCSAERVTCDCDGGTGVGGEQDAHCVEDGGLQTEVGEVESSVHHAPWGGGRQGKFKMWAVASKSV